MTTLSQFCINLIPEFFKPAGPILEKTQLSKENNRSLLQAKITNGFRKADFSKVEVELEGINLQPGKNLFRQNCFEFNCFQEEGIFTYIKGISSVCLVEQGNNLPNKLMTLRERTLSNKSCSIDNLGNVTYFVTGTKDVNNYVYAADIGTVNLTSGVISIVDQNVPFYSSDKPNSLFASSVQKISNGVKVAIIKRISKNTIDILGTVYGELDNEFYFPHTTLIKNRKYTSKGQKLNLENLSINLLMLTSFKKFEVLDYQTIYRNINYSSPLLENVAELSGVNLLNLINTDELPQKGSIPLHIASFSSNQKEYNSLANDNYINRIKECFDHTCFERDCFEKITNNNLLNRSIDNRSIAWLIQYLASYSINYNKDITVEIQTILSYLINQKDKKTLLYFKGWDEQVQEELCDEVETESQLDILTENNQNICSEVTEETDTNNLKYSNTLTLNQEILTSTNVAIFFAFLKGFELTQDFNYILEANQVYNAIKKYLVGADNMFKHSLLEFQTSIESATYHLLFTLVLEEYEAVNELINFFQQRLIALPVQSNEEVFVGTSLVLVGSESVVIPPLNILQSDDDFNLFTNTSVDTITTVEDIFKYNYLIYSSLNYINNKIYIPFLPSIQEKYNLIQEKIETDRNQSSLIFAIGSLIDNKSFLDINNLKFNTIETFNNYRFQQDFIFNNLFLATPQDYGWYNPSTFNKDSHIGQIYSSLAVVLAYTNTKHEYNKKLLSIDNMYGILLNKKAQDYNLTRFNKEDDAIFRTRIKAEIFNRGITRLAIENKLKLYNSTPTIKDNYQAILGYEDENSLYNNSWGVGYLQGPKTFNTNITTLNFAQPVEKDVYKEIQRLKPAGIKINIVETLTFNIEKNKTLINIKEESNDFINCTNIALENTNNFITENNSIICSEII